MSRSSLDPRDLLGFFNPWTLSRIFWLAGKRGWARLWRAPGANARFFIGTGFVWSTAMALTDPFKALYLSKLGLSHLAIGGFFALDMGLRVVGVVAGGLFAQRWGHKFTLILFDALSWSLASLVLALAREPWQVYLATCLTASNAMVAGSVVQLLVDGTPVDKRTPTFALFNLSFVLPALFLPALSGWMVQRWGVEPVMRLLLGWTALSTALATAWRWHRLEESVHASQPELAAVLNDVVATVRHLWKQATFWPVLGLGLLSNAVVNLNKAWQPLFIAERLGLGGAWIGRMASATSLAFVLVSLLWVPRLKAGSTGRLFFWACLLGVGPALGLAWARHPTVLIVWGLVGGALGALQGPLLSEHIVALFPPGREGLAQALLSSGMQVAVALSLLLGGALFETRFGAYPWMMGALAACMGWLAWKLERKI